MSYNGWIIDENTREYINEEFSFENHYAHHITNIFGSNANFVPEFSVVEFLFKIIDHDLGVEAIICKVDDKLTRNDGSFYHCTWSTKKNVKPVSSNRLMKKDDLGVWFVNNPNAEIKNINKTFVLKGFIEKYD